MRSMKYNKSFKQLDQTTNSLSFLYYLIVNNLVTYQFRMRSMKYNQSYQQLDQLKFFIFLSYPEEFLQLITGTSPTVLFPTKMFYTPQERQILYLGTVPT
jgi:hypothetical protein